MIEEFYTNYTNYKKILVDFASWHTKILSHLATIK